MHYLTQNPLRILTPVQNQVAFFKTADLYQHSFQLILDDKSSDPKSSEQVENVDKEVKLNTDKKVKVKVERDSSRTLTSGNTTSSNDGNDKESLISPKQESSASTGPSSKASTPKAEAVQVQVTKKRRMDRDGTAVATATTLTVRQEETGPMSTGRIKGFVKHSRQVNERFRRVDPSKMEPIADNRYVAKVQRHTHHQLVLFFSHLCKGCTHK